jgi:hypothetical protein
VVRGKAELGTVNDEPNVEWLLLQTVDNGRFRQSSHEMYNTLFRNPWAFSAKFRIIRLKGRPKISAGLCLGDQDHRCRGLFNPRCA